jgi:hypothetical protein
MYLTFQFLIYVNVCWFLVFATFASNQQKGRGEVTFRVFEDTNANSLIYVYILKGDNYEKKVSMKKVSAKYICSHKLTNCELFGNDNCSYFTRATFSEQLFFYQNFLVSLSYEHLQLEQTYAI